MASAASTAAGIGRFEQLRLARDIVRAEAAALEALAAGLGDEFCAALDIIANCRGAVIVCGIGKAGLIGQKISATLASTGARSHFVHPAEAIHGDLGRIHGDDVVLMLSHSGETEEMVRLLPSLAQLGAPIIAITSSADSTLARAASATLTLGEIREACTLGLAPSVSTSAMLAAGDALALVLSWQRNFRAEDFARLHPGGSLGRKLTKVEEIMRPLAECRLAPDTLSVREALVQVSRPGRRTGAIMLVDEQGVLSGIFTDSDLTRLLETRRDESIDRPIAQVMTRGPQTLRAGASWAEALAVFSSRKLSELPIVDGEGKPVGLIDITDAISATSAMSPSAGPLPAQNEEREKTVRFPNRAAG